MIQFLPLESLRNEAFVALLAEASGHGQDDARRLVDDELAATEVVGTLDENGIAAFAAYEVLPDAVRIADVAVRPDCRHQGLGAQLLLSISREHLVPLLAETDEDAVGFYRRVGFTVSEAAEKGGRQRYCCVLPSPR